MKNDNGGPAFPTTPEHARRCNGEGGSGMNLRDYFAAKADVSVYRPLETLASKLGREPSIEELAFYVAKIRIIEADTMLAERAK